MNKRLVSIIVLLVALVCMNSTYVTKANAQTFKDVGTKDSYYEAVEYLASEGIISSNLENFNPNNNITRGQLAKMLAVALKLDIKNVKNPNFKDVPTKHEFYPYIAALANKKTISGYADGTFGINKPVKKSHLAKFIVNGFEMPIRAQYEQPVSDVAKNTETNTYVSTLYFYDIENWKKYNPSSNAKRYVVAKYIYNAAKSKTMIQNQKEIKYPTKLSKTMQQFFTFTDTKNIGKADYLTNSFVLLPTEKERGMYLPMDNQHDKKIQFEVNEQGKVVHLSLVDELETKYKVVSSFAQERVNYFSDAQIVAVKYENFSKPSMTPVFGEKATVTYGRNSFDVIRVEDSYQAFGDNLFTDVYKATLTLSDGREEVRYYEMEEYDFEVFGNVLYPISNVFESGFADMDINAPFTIEGPKTYEIYKDDVIDENGQIIRFKGITFKGEGKYKMIQNNIVHYVVEIKNVNGQLFAKYVSNESKNSMVTTYEKLYK